MKLWIKSGAMSVLVVMLLIPGAEAASRSRLKICGDAWIAAKVAGKVSAGQGWQDFYAACSARLQATEPVRPFRDDRRDREPPRAAASLPLAGSGSGGQLYQGQAGPRKGDSSARSRQKQCAAQWKQLKSAGQVPEGQTWPQFWSACNARLKEKE